MASILVDMVDWDLVEIRNGTMASDEVGRRAGILTSSGQITDLDGSPLKFSGLTDGSYHIVVSHRNHLAIMSADEVKALLDCHESPNCSKRNEADRLQRKRNCSTSPRNH